MRLIDPALGTTRNDRRHVHDGVDGPFVPDEVNIAAVIDEAVGAVAGVIGRTEDGAEVELELLLLPLAHSPSRVRALGILTPPAPPYWLGERPVIELDLRTLRHIGAEQAEMGHQRFAQERDGRRTRHGFLVYSGGRESPSSEQTG